VRNVWRSGESVPWVTVAPRGQCAGATRRRTCVGSGRLTMARYDASVERLGLKSSSNRRRDRRLLVVSAIGVDILSAFRKVSTKPDQGRARVNARGRPASSPAR
jgi:hypothetical protein